MCDGAISSTFAENSVKFGVGSGHVSIPGHLTSSVSHPNEVSPMTTLLLMAMGMFFGFIWLAWWLGRKAAANPAATAELGLRLGKMLLK
jgi:hypothetical protein